MKKVLYIALCAVLVALFVGGVSCQADCEVAVTAKEAILVSEDGQVLAEHNATEHRPIASMTKIMTLLCVYDALDDNKISLDDQVCVSERAASMGGSQVFLEQGGTYTVNNLIKSVVVCSANDSCVALAEHVSGSVESFVKTMNEKCADLGLVDTHFDNCTGLPAVSQYSCAKDVSVMLRNLVKHPHYFTCSRIWMEDFAHPGGRVTGMTNTNKLVRFYQGCDGGKTGFTSEAGHCLAATAVRNGMRVFAVVVGATDSKTRFKEVSDMFNYAFANYEQKVYLADNEKIGDIDVVGGKAKSAEVVSDGQLTFFGKKGQSACTVTVEQLDHIQAPVRKGDIIGTARLLRDGEEVATVKLVAACGVEAKSYLDYVKEIVCGQ